MAEPFYAVGPVPTHSCLMLGSAEEARQFPSATVSLGCCETCGFVANTEFDPVWSAYAPNYEDQQGFSPTYSSFAENLATETAQRFDLKGKSVVEIGCSKGDFLAALCEAGAMDAVGIDPSAVEGRVPPPSRGAMRLVADYYGSEHFSFKADLICCRHTLEHIQPVHDTLVLIRTHMERNPESVLMIEVPNAGRIWSDFAFEDVYYEHCSYFTAGTLASSLRRAGFSIEDLRLEYDDQYLVAFASLSPDADRRFAIEETPEEQQAVIGHFSTDVKTSVSAWRAWFNSEDQSGKRLAIWGSGSKCVAFLHTIKANDQVDMIIDINPHRTGRYAPGLSTAISAPKDLLSLPADPIILMNSIYRREIEAMLDSMGLHPELFTIDRPPA